MKINKILIVLLLVISCGTDKDQENLSKVFRYNEHSNIRTLDPAFAKDQAHIWAINQVFSGLVKMDYDLNIVGDIADSWTISEDGLLYEFQIREGVLFHDNICFSDYIQREVNAEDFVFSLNRLRSSELAAPGSWVMSNVKEIKALDKRVLQIELEKPFPPFLSLLAMKYCSVVPEEAVQYYKEDFGLNPVGTGPFYFKIWAPNVKLVLRKNSSYYQMDSDGSQLPKLEAVAIGFLPDKQSEFLGFLQGNLDMISGLDPSYKDEILSPIGELNAIYQKDYTLLKGPFLNTEYLGINTQMDGPLQFKEVRQALNAGFDRKKMMTYLRNNVGVAGESGIIPSGLPGYTGETFYTYHPLKSRKIISEFKQKYPEVDWSLTLSTNSQYVDLCEFIQKQWESLGIAVQVEVLPPSTLRQSKATGKLSMFRASWIADYPDAENYLSLFYSSNFAPNGPNYTYFKNDVYDGLYEQIIRDTRRDSRVATYQKMDSLIMSEAPIVPLYYDEFIRVIPKQIKGMKIDALNGLDLRFVEKLR
jgi:peptide/nickel transport system substrate-binding protein